MKLDANPRDLTDAALDCAISACCKSQWLSDRQFAAACADELDRRLWLARGIAKPRVAEPAEACA